MNSNVIQPESHQELLDAVASHARVLAVGSRTKPALSDATDATLVSLAQMRGIIEYEPSEFTFTARAGTAVAELVTTLGERHQYLPFDPMLVEAGATLAGTVAAGLSGPGRCRYGGIRDFLLGVQFVSGDGETINAGGKVVKNAAGFDIPKLLVGSAGRLAIMTELTFKVFPKPPALQTLRVECDSDAEAIRRMSAAASSRWELDAIDYRPRAQAVYLRLGAHETVNDAIASDIQQKWGSDVSTLDANDAAELWRSVLELNWRPGAVAMLKVPITPERFLKLRDLLCKDDGLSMHLSAAGGVVWIAVESDASLSRLAQALEQIELPGLVLRGTADSIWIGPCSESQMSVRIKDAMDPSGKFPDLMTTTASIR